MSINPCRIDGGSAQVACQGRIRCGIRRATIAARDPKYVESPLSVELLGGKYKDGATVLVDVDEANNRFSFQKASRSRKPRNK